MADEFDGLMSQFGVFKPADISAQAASIVSTAYNGGVGTQYGKLSTDFKTDSGLTNWHDLNEYEGNAVDAHGSSDWTDNNTVTSGIGPGTDKIADESSNSNHGTITGYTNSGDIVSTDVPSALAGSVDYSMEFNGVNQVVDCGSSTVLDNLSESAFSVCCWIRVASGSSGDRSILTNFDNSVGWQIRVKGDGVIRFIRASSPFDYSGNDSTTSVTGDVWCHVAGTWDGAAEYKTYFDASAESAPLSDGTVGSTVTNLRTGIGLSGDNTQDFDGNIADARVYDRVLTSDEVTYLYTNGASGTDPTTTNLVGQWGGSNDSYPVGAVVDGQPVIRIEDRSDSAADGTSTTLSKRPIYDSANTALTFDDVDDLMDFVSSVALTDCTIFVKTILASDVTSATSQKTLLGTQSAGAASDGAALITLGATSAGLTNETASMLAQDNATTRGVGYATTISSGTRVLTFRLDGTTEAIYLDGSSVSVSEDSGGSLDSATAGQRFDRVSRLGSDSTPGNYLGDKIVEVLIYDSALSTGDIDSVHTYLGL